MSSILPDTTIDGTADTKPEINRPTKAPEIDGTKPTMAQAIQYTSDDEM